MLSGILPGNVRSAKRIVGLRDGEIDFDLLLRVLHDEPRERFAVGRGERHAGMPSVVELPKKISAKPSARMARMPK